MNLVIQISGCDAIPVRAVLLVTLGKVTPQRLALELSKPDSQRKFGAYEYCQGEVVPIRAETWAMQHERLTSIAHGFKHKEPEFENAERDQHREAAWRKSLELLPPGAFVRLEEFKKWYDEKTYYSPYSVWEEQHRVVGEDDDPEPQFQLKRQCDTLDLHPIGVGDWEDLIFQGFEALFVAPVTTSAQTAFTPASVASEVARAGIATVKNKSKESVAFDKAVLEGMTTVWNTWKMNQAKDKSLKEPTKSAMCEAVL